MLVRKNKGRQTAERLPKAGHLQPGRRDGGEIQRLHVWPFTTGTVTAIDRQREATKRPFNNSLLAIRPGGLKEIGATHVVWQAKRGVPEVPSPLLYDGYIYMIRNGGVLTCVEANSGKEAYASKRLPAAGIYYASPVAGDGKVYVTSDSGVVTVLKAGPKYEVLAENDLGETIRATPALVDGRIYLRTAGYLYAFGE